MVIVYRINHAKSNASQGILYPNVVVKHDRRFAESRPSVADRVSVILEQVQLEKAASAIIGWSATQNVNPANPVIVKPTKVWP